MLGTRTGRGGWRVSARKKTWIGIGVGVLGLIALAKSLSLPMAASGAAAVALGLLIVALLEKIVFSPLDRLGQGVRALSGRKSLERALEVSEREKALILNAMSQRVVYQTPDHRVVWANRAAAESVNALPEELPGRRCYEIWQGRAEPCVDCPLDKTVQTGQPHEAEIASPDGRTWLTRSFPVQGENGALDGLMEVSRDVTAHKSAREALAYEQRLFSILTDNIPDNIYFKDTQSRFLRINRALAAYFGLSDPAESIGKTDADFFSEEHARQAFLDEQESIRSGLPLIGKEEKETWPSAEETWVSTTKVPFRDEKGGIIGIFGISRNITERKRAEQEREKLIAELEAKNAEL
jgi:PAS domain S-box-containing protein